MIKLEQFKECGINISDELTGNAALEFLANNTTLAVDINDVETVKALPFSAKMFITKYEEVVSASSIVSSESIEGLSQSFKTGNKADLLDDLLNTLLGDYLKGKVTFVAAKKRWR